MNKRAEELKNIERYDIYDLCEIVSLLRDEKDGCPWDRIQTHDTLRHNFIEETYEVVEAINKKDSELLCEELGDVLLQIIFHAQIEKEENKFGIEDVIDGVCRKMVYRHPHVFSDFYGNVEENWEKLKNKEKKRDSKTEIFSSVPKELPALIRAQKIWKKAGKDCSYTSEYDEKSAVLIKEKLNEKSPEKREEAAGKMLFDICRILLDCEINAEQALTRATDDFIVNYQSESLAESKDQKM